MRRPWAAAAVAVLAACGGGEEVTLTVEDWRERHAAVVAEVGPAIERVQASTKEGEPTAIRANCEGLRDVLLEAGGVPPVPDPEAEGKLRTALRSVEGATESCVRAMTRGDVRLLERSIVELREAQLHLDTAEAALGI